MITIDTILATRPCSNWPRDRVASVVKSIDTSAWTAAVRSAWGKLPDRDIGLTVCRHAARNHQPVLVAWMQHVTVLRVDAQEKRWPQAPERVKAIWARLRAWDGTADQAREIRRAAYAAYAASYAADAYRSLILNLCERIDAAEAP